MVGNSGERAVKSKYRVIMSAKLFVGNLSFNATENQLQDLFAAHGNVIEVDMILDKISGRPRGSAFITMENQEGASIAAKETLKLQNFKSQALVLGIFNFYGLISAQSGEDQAWLPSL